MKGLYLCFLAFKQLTAERKRGVNGSKFKIKTGYSDKVQITECSRHGDFFFFFQRNSIFLFDSERESQAEKTITQTDLLSAATPGSTQSDNKSRF